jgi:2-keto-3-deoxy-L-arabinonate dehydratase
LNRAAGVTAKLREMMELGGDAIEGPWNGEEAITLVPDLDAGATGSITGGYRDAIPRMVDEYQAGRRDQAAAATSAGCR